MDAGAGHDHTVFPAATSERGLITLDAEGTHALLGGAPPQGDAGASRDVPLERILASKPRARRNAAAHPRVGTGTAGEVGRRDRAPGLAGTGPRNLRRRARESFDRRILWASTDFVTMLDLDGRLVAVGENGPAAFSPEAGLVGRPWIDVWTAAESRAEIRRALDAARDGRPSRFQAVFDVAAEEPTWWDIAVTPVAGDDDRPEGILAVSRDITDLKRNEARQTLLMQELAHRVKNTLALVQAVAVQTLRNAPSLEAAGETLGARLMALAQAHDVLMQGAWSSASLASLVAGAVTLHGDGAPDRFVVSGPDLTLDARLGLTLALMLHELATNAAKYGALSTGAGRVAITWDVAGPEANARLRFRWEEIGGPCVEPPTRTGFGTRLISRTLSHGFGGTVALGFPATGVVLTLEASLAAIVAA